MYGADNPSSFSKGDTWMGYKRVGSLLVHENIIFETVLILKNYECLACSILLYTIERWILK